jgi:DNA-binding transcriptional LysR family regulator
MDVSQLRTLIHVAELGSLSRAADRLGIAQPALSRQVKLLEEELGARLFDRHGRGMVPTEAGLRVLDHAARIMAELDAIRGAANPDGASLRGIVTIGTTPTVATLLPVPLALRVRERHPQLGLRFASAFSGHLIDWVQRGEVDLAVSYDPQPLRSLRIEKLMVEELVLVGPPDWGLALDAPVPFRRLGERPLVLPSAGHGLRRVIDDCARTAGIALEAGIEANSFETMIDLVRGGFGATVLPLGPVRREIEAGRLGAAPLVAPTPTRTLVVAQAADRPTTPAARFVAATLVEVVAEIVGAGGAGWLVPPPPKP